MVKGKMLTIFDDIQEVIQIRERVFNEELNYSLDFTSENTVEEIVLVEENENYIGTGSISFDGYKYEISNIAVLSEYRKKQYGDFVIRMLINKAIISNAREVELWSNLEAVSFFLKYGFQEQRQDKGKNFFNVNMKLNLKDFHLCCKGKKVDM